MTRQPLSYSAEGSTRPADVEWPATPPGFRRFEQVVRIGEGPLLWDHAAREVLLWGVKTRSGFEVRPVDGGDPGVRVGADYTLVAGVGPLRVREPVRVVAVVDRDDRVGFAYGTLPGHPVSGEEAFVVSRTPDGSVWLTLRSLTRPAEGRWGTVFPVLLLAQRGYRVRYRRSLRRTPE